MLEMLYNPNFVTGLLSALVAGLFTGVGGFCIYLKQKYSQNTINAMLNIAAGVMLAVSFFALLVPSMQQICRHYTNVFVAGFWFCAAMSAGMVLVWVLNIVLPHEHNNMVQRKSRLSLKQAWLFIIAICLHKLPEGLAVGVAYGAEELTDPESLVIGVAIHNIIEGLTIALSLVAAGESRLKSGLIALLIGMIQPLGALAGLMLIGLSAQIVALAMALSGATLLFVIVGEILPETYACQNTQKSATAFFSGFVMMSFLFMVFGA